MTELSVVGKSVTRIDALEKVTGAAKYTTDVELNVPGMLYGKVLYSPLAHARIVGIDTLAAKRLPGVKAVITGEDVPDIRGGRLVADRHLLTKDRVRFIGDAVAVVAANTVETAEEALDLIKVEYEELPALFDAEQAMKPDCTVIIHSELPNYARQLHPYLGKDLPGPNVHTHHKVRKGDVDKGFTEADLIIENRYKVSRIAHCQMEPYNAVASVENDGTLTVWISTHMLFRVQAEISSIFGYSPGMVRFKAKYIGGNFGASPRAERFATLLALKTGKPVKVVYSREECFIDGLNRLPYIIYIKDGIKSDGILVARQMKLICNGGAYASSTPLIIRNGSYGTSMYRIPNFKWDTYGIYTNEPPCGALRGFGNEQTYWAIEQQMDIIAEKLAMDPVELRKKNLIKEGEENLRGEVTHSIGAEECLDKAAEWIEWGRPSEVTVGNIRKGKGLALANKYTAIESTSAAIVKIHKDGTVEVRHGSDEVGQGANTVMAQITAEELNVPPEKIRIVWGDTARVPYDDGAVSSRTTLMTGNAVKLACQDARRQLLEMASPLLGTSPEELETGDGMVYMKKSPQKMVKIAALFRLDAKGGQKAALCPTEGAELLGRSTFFFSDISDDDPETGQGKRQTTSYCYSAQAVEVAVDIETGMVKVLRICAANDTGQPINPKLCEGQMEGGIGMGIGNAIYEEIKLDKGKVVNPNFTGYKMPGMMEVPSGDNMKSIIISAPHRDGPYGAKGSGEAAMTPSAAAIANAVNNAIGVRIKDLPITPEKVLKALHSI
ncbi:xanthine dehydrogenase family protein molybdopterin-binding subunit [Chloroflexota bacterium]